MVRPEMHGPAHQHRIKMMTDLGVPPETATIAYEAAVEAAHAGVDAMMASVGTIENEEVRHIAHLTALKLVGVNCQAALELAATEGLMRAMGLDPETLQRS